LSSRLNRQTFIKNSIAAGVAFAGVPAFIPNRGRAADLLTIGVTEELTGVYAEPARNELRGIRMAVDERNKRGGVLSRQIQLAVEDNANNPGTGVEKARKLIQVDKAVALIGSVNSGVSIATSGVAFENKIPFIDTGGHADQVTGAGCHWTTFRTCHSTWMETHATGLSIEITKKFGKKWYFIAPDYAFGHALLTGYNDIAGKLGITVAGTDLTPLGTSDFSAYLTKVQDAKPDVLVVMVQGDDLVNCLKQANSSGFLKRFPIAGPQGELEVFWSLPKEARVGFWGFEWYYNSPLVLGKNRRAKAFIADYVAQYNQPPTARSVFGYISAGRMLEAIEAAKDTDAVKVCKAIESQKFDVLSNQDGYYRDVDHQLIWPMWFGQIRADGTPQDQFDIFDVLDEQPGDKIERTADEARGICKMAYP
jgi:branched-chain amino acid transport system substrate-binding protein